MRRLFTPALALCCVAATLAPRPSHAELVFRGEHREHEALIRSLFASLPARGKAVDVYVREVPAADWSRVVEDDDPDAVGLYDDQTHEIFLKGGEPDLEWTFIHEYGHHVFFASMNRAERGDWKRYWATHQAEMPEGDAREEAEEGFAECYAGLFCHAPMPWTLASAIKDKTQAYFTPAAAARTAVAARTGAGVGKRLTRTP